MVNTCRKNTPYKVLDFQLAGRAVVVVVENCWSWFLFWLWEGMLALLMILLFFLSNRVNRRHFSIADCVISKINRKLTKYFIIPSANASTQFVSFYMIVRKLIALSMSERSIPVSWDNLLRFLECNKSWRLFLLIPVSIS